MKEIVVAIITSVLIGLLTSLPVMCLWNLLIPEILGLTTLTFLEAFGLNLLCGLLFRSSTRSSK